jgi:hypothetical protein
MVATYFEVSYDERFASTCTCHATKLGHKFSLIMIPPLPSPPLMLSLYDQYIALNLPMISLFASLYVRQDIQPLSTMSPKYMFGASADEVHFLTLVPRIKFLLCSIKSINHFHVMVYPTSRRLLCGTTLLCSDSAYLDHN